MGFNLYFAGSQSKETMNHLLKRKCHRLLSNAGERGLINDYSSLPEDTKPEIIVDSGAFSVAHAGKKIDIDEYIEYINSHPNVEHWVELDVIPFPFTKMSQFRECAELSWNNYLYMLKKVNCPEKIMPLYHFGEPKECLQRILETPCVNGHYPTYIGIGGRHGVSTEMQIRYFTDIFKIIRNSKNPNVKVHAFGITVFKILERFPFYSSDSTTWIQIGANGGIMTPFGIICVSEKQKHSFDSYFTKTQQEKDVLNELFKKFGYTIDELSTDYKKRMCFNIDYLKNWAENYEYKPEFRIPSKLF